jgi:AraC-like DNA-binding protein/quercetin dioxygenase-like cupin family protein
VLNFDGTLLPGTAGLVLVNVLNERGVCTRTGAAKLFEFVRNAAESDLHTREAASTAYQLWVDALAGVRVEAVENVAREAWRRQRAELFSFARPMVDLLRQQGYTIVLFSGSPREIVHEAAADLGLDQARGHLVYAARGVLSVHTERGTSIVPANRVAWTPAKFTHWHGAHGNTDMRIVFLPASLARLIPERPAVFLASDLAREVLLTLTGPRNHGPAARTVDRAAQARLRRVLVDELQEADEQPLQLPEPRDDRLRAIAELLRESAADNTALADLGRTIGASPRTLSRLFHDELGMTFYEWRTQLRIYHALVLLADGHDTTHVDHACGWANPSHFIAAFTGLVGTTPGRHRTSHQRRPSP